MNKELIKQFGLAIRVGQMRINKKAGWVQVKCPLAPWRHKSGRDKNPSFGLYFHPSKMSKAHCFSCGFVGDLHELVTAIKTLSKNDRTYDYKKALQLIALEEEGGGLAFGYGDEDESTRPNEIHLFKDDWLRSFTPAIKVEAAMAYAAKRGVPEWVVKELKLRYDSREKRICFPVRDFEGRLVGFHGRGIKKKVVPPYRMYTDTYPAKGGKNNPQCWYGESWVDWEKPVVIVESVFDLVAVYEFYKNVICPLTAEITEDKIKRLGDMQRAILMFDGDVAGRRASLKMKKYLPKVKFKDVYLPEGEDAGSIGKTEIVKILKKHLKSNLLTIGA